MAGQDDDYGPRRKRDDVHEFPPGNYTCLCSAIAARFAEVGDLLHGMGVVRLSIGTPRQIVSNIVEKRRIRRACSQTFRIKLESY